MKDDGKPTSADYTAADWAKAGYEPRDATDRRDLQEKMRARGAEGLLKITEKLDPTKPPEFMTLLEEAEFLNRATAVSRKVAQQGDMVNLPGHYARFKIEPIRFIGENKLDWFQGNIVKYSLRHDAKNGLEDIRKCIRYANMYLLYLQGDPDWWKAGKPEDLQIGQ